MPELSKLHGYGATGLHSRSQEYGEREEGKGVQSWGFPMGLMLKKEGTTGGHGGGLCTGRDREGRSLGEVEEGVGMLTVEATELWWPNTGDR